MTLKILEYILFFFLNLNCELTMETVDLSHCTSQIMTGSFGGRGNQYIQLVKVLHCKLPTIGKQLSVFPT